MFGTGLATYDFHIFDGLIMGEIYGEIFIVIALIVNAIVLLNFVIAVLADTYADLSKH